MQYSQNRLSKYKKQSTAENQKFIPGSQLHDGKHKEEMNNKRPFCKV